MQHWCKQAIEDAQNSETSVTTPPAYPPPPNSASVTDNSTTNSTATAQQYTSQEYAQYYAQYAQQYPNQYSTTNYAIDPNLAAYQNNQYWHYYQQYYPGYIQQQPVSPQVQLNQKPVGFPGQAPTATSVGATAPAIQKTSVTAPTYAAVVAHGTTAWQQPAAVATKKPNPTRFMSANSVTTTSTISNLSASKPSSTTTTTTSATTTTTTSTTTKSATVLEGWPPSLTAYIAKAFAICSNDQERKAMEASLRVTITKATTEGYIKTYQWEYADLPNPKELLQPKSQTTVTNIESPKKDAKKDLRRNAATALEDQKIKIKEEELVTPTGKRKKSRWENATEEKTEVIKDSEYVVKSKQSSALSDRSKSIINKTINPLQVLNSMSESTPPALSSEEIRIRQQRANRFQSSESSNGIKTENVTDSSSNINSRYTQQQSQPIYQTKKEKKNKKRTRNNDYYYNPNNTGVPAITSTISNSLLSGGGGMTDQEMECLRVVGTNPRLEKDYFRLTSAPDPATVRPEAVLRRSMALLKSKWENDEVEYVYMCNQLKSVRQDLTVQHIQNDLTVDVYETHARVALESDDMNEYNQCQTQLKQLYASGIRGAEMEFLAYRILYYVSLLGNTKYQGGSADLIRIVASLSSNSLSDMSVSHALKIRRAVQLENYHSVFRLYTDTPNLGSYILDTAVDCWRIKFLQRIVKAYKPQVSVTFVISELGFDSEEEGKEFLKKAGAVLVEDPDTLALELDTKLTIVDGATMTQDKLLL